VILALELWLIVEAIRAYARLRGMLAAELPAEAGK